MKFCVGIVQLTSSDNLQRNLEKMRVFGEQAKAQGADLIVYPELVYYTARPEVWRERLNDYAQLLTQFGSWAKEWGVYLVPGTLREPQPGGKPFNSAPFFNRAGELLANYRKQHLFSAHLPDRSYQEPDFYNAGQTSCLVDTEMGKIGVTICFDVRFPALYQNLKQQGAVVVLVPSAFTVPTGSAHWETLLRARAIDNQFFVIAPGQTGISGEGAAKFGHSLAVDPWGRVLADMGDTQGVCAVEIDTALIDEAHRRIHLGSPTERA